MRSGHEARQATPGTEPSRYVSWAWGLIAVTLPAAIVAVVAVSALDIGTRWANAAVYVAVVTPLVASIVVGLRGWRREHESPALRAAVLSALVAAAGTALVLLS